MEEYQVLYFYDTALKARLSSLTYEELRQMLPTIDDDRYLPRPERLERDSCDDRFLSAVFPGCKITVYRSGLFYYREARRATTYTVSGCAELAYRSAAKNLQAEGEETAGMPWYLPLMVAGALRIEKNMHRRPSPRTAFHYGPGTVDWSTMPSLASYEEEACQADMERERQEKARQLLADAGREMTARQEQVFWLIHGLGMTQQQAAQVLGTTQANISVTLKRAVSRLKKYRHKRTKS